MRPAPDRWTGWTTIGFVAWLALIAGTVSYLAATHRMPTVVTPERHRQAP